VVEPDLFTRRSARRPVAARHAAPSGPFNLVAPAALTNRAFTSALARQLHRPARLRVPSTALRIALGRDLADGAVLASQRVVPAALTERGFNFENPTIESIVSSSFA